MMLYESIERIRCMVAVYDDNEWWWWVMIVNEYNEWWWLNTMNDNEWCWQRMIAVYDNSEWQWQMIMICDNSEWWWQRMMMVNMKVIMSFEIGDGNADEDDNINWIQVWGSNRWPGEILKNILN